MKKAYQIIIFLLIGIISIVCYSTYKNNNLVFDSVTTEKLLQNKHDNNIYIDKKIIVTGSIKEIMNANGKYAILLQGINGKNILCELKENQTLEIQNLETNQKIEISGVFKGELSDLILLNCELLDSERNE